jgi:sugar/nucleoside kinase (ribokinase family)
MSTRVPDYVAIGHLTLDRTSEGDALGGTVIYAALAAARYGARVAILTRANLDSMPDAQRELLASLTADLDVIVQSSRSTTTFTNREVGGRRTQEIHSWAGEIDLNGLPPLWRSAGVIHLAPVAQEVDPRQVHRLSPTLLGCTPQGWMREWRGARAGHVRIETLRLPPDLVSRIDAIVVSSEESVAARDVLEAVGERGLAVVTRGQQGADAIDRGRRFDVQSYPVRAVDSVGAGDVFAGALFAARGNRDGVAASTRYASAAAALKVTGHGVESVPGREDVLALVERHRS